MSYSLSDLLTGLDMEPHRPHFIAGDAGEITPLGVTLTAPVHCGLDHLLQLCLPGSPDALRL